MNLLKLLNSSVLKFKGLKKLLIFLRPEKHPTMNKNSIHNFNITIRNSTDIKSSQELTKVIIKELAKVSKEMSQQKDILQEWQEQKIQIATTATNNLCTLPEGGATDTAAERIMRTATLMSNTPSDSGEAVPRFKAANGTAEQASNIFNIQSVADTTGIVNTGFSQSGINNLSVFTAENDTLNFSKGVTTKYYVATQQTLMVPQTYKKNTGEPYIDAVKAEIKRKLEVAIAVDNVLEINYWRNISKAFEEEATAKDFDGKPSDILFTKMYALLKQSSIIETQNFNWEIVCKKMIESIGANILNGTISEKNKNRWETIRKQLGDDKINIANLFEQYNELFLLLKQVEGLDSLPNTITITTKTKIYPNLSADKLYADIGKNDVYVFLKEISNEDIQGSAVYKGAIKIRNTAATSFVVGEGLEFFLDENFINQNLYQKENINWIVCNIKDKKDKGTIFVNEGTSFNYNFDKPGIYRIDAYGRKDTIAGKKIAKSSTFIELEIVAQQIIITPPSFIKNEVARAFSEEKFFKISLKNDAVKTLNALKLYYQLETVTVNKVIKISAEQKLDATGIIKLAMPALGDYKIKVISKDQYALTQDCKISVIKNEVTSIGVAKESFNKKIFLLGDSNKTLALETKNFRINPATNEEKEGVKWIIYDSNNKVYLPSGSVMLTDDNNTKKTYLYKWNSFDVPIPQKVGYYTVEAYSDVQKVTKSQSVFKFEVKHPQVTEAYWASSGGSKKETSGFSGESNWIKTNIPYYSNQPVRIYFYLNNKKTNHYCDLKTNEEGIIFKEIKFDSEFKKLIGFHNGKNAKIGFKVLGIQNGKPYQFMVPNNYESDTVLSCTTDVKILDVYFMYKGIRVNSFTSVPYGAKINGVIKTLNMVGNEVVLKVRRKNAQHSLLKMKTIVKSEGEASITFTLDKKWRPITPLFDIIDSYYLGVEGVESKLYLKNGMNAVVRDFKDAPNKKEILDENDPQLIWGSKVSKEFRLRVVEMAKDIKVDPNWIMIIIAKETSLTFDPHIDNGIGYVGLIQFSEASAEDVGTTHAELKKMTAVTQLNYVEKRFIRYGKNGYKSLADLYFAVLQPTSVGQGDKDGNVLWTSQRMAYYNNPSYHKEKGEYDNKIIKKGKTKRGFDEGTTYMWEVRQELERIEKEGWYARNTWRNPLDKMELRGWYNTWRPEDSNHGIVPTRSKGKHDGLDLYAPVGTPVFACVDGIRVSVGPDPSSSYGNTITIKGFYNGKEYHFFYAHLSETYIKIGEKVNAGKKIGLTGKTGNAKDLLAKQTHLHFEVRKSNASQGAGIGPFNAISELENTVNMNPSKENQK